jgi:predicted DNA-binding transcriptional regulator AlpA
MNEKESEMKDTQMIFLKDIEVAELINIKVNTLRTWREHGRGPKYIKAEGKRGSVRYERKEITHWIQESRERGRKE